MLDAVAVDGVLLQSPAGDDDAAGVVEAGAKPTAGTVGRRDENAALAEVQGRGPVEIGEGVAPVTAEAYAEAGVDLGHGVDGAVERDVEPAVGQDPGDLLRLAEAVAQHDRLAPRPKGGLDAVEQLV